MKYIIAALTIFAIACHEDRDTSRDYEDAGAVEDVEGDGYVRPEPDERGDCPEGWHWFEYVVNGDRELSQCFKLCSHDSDWCPPMEQCYPDMGICFEE
jgi:hypothetical protein